MTLSGRKDEPQESVILLWPFEVGRNRCASQNLKAFVIDKPQEKE